MRWSRLIATTMMTGAFLVTGCNQSTQNNSDNGVSNTADTSTAPAAPTEHGPIPPPSPAKPDGTVETSEVITSSNNHSLYDLTYWSDGVLVSAYAEIPDSHGSYPMVVVCHDDGLPNLASYSESGFKERNLSLHSKNVIYVYSQFRGYGDSGGYVGDFPARALDIQNAITAVATLSKAKPTGVYLYGIGVGATTALLVASQRHDVKAVLADNPYVSLDEFVKYYTEGHPALAMKNLFRSMPAIFDNGKFSVQNDADKIKAPVLLLASQAKARPVWKPVEDLYGQMRQSHVTVQFLTYQDLSPTGRQKSEENAWLRKTGFPKFEDADQLMQ